jgi:hypothetical protein
VLLNLKGQDTSLKLEFINDVPSHVGKVTVHPVLGKLDSAGNILANKLTALISREEPKDLADIWGFCCKMSLSLKEAITAAQSKAAGIFPADLGRIILSVSKTDWNLVRWSNGPSANEFIRDLHELGEKLVLVE